MLETMSFFAYSHARDAAQVALHVKHVVALTVQVHFCASGYPRTVTHLIKRTLATVAKADWSQSQFTPEAIFVTVGQNDFTSPR